MTQTYADPTAANAREAAGPDQPPGRPTTRTLQQLRQELAAQNGGTDPYADLDDQQLAGALHRRYYADIPRERFDQMVGLPAPPPREPTWTERVASKLAGGRALAVDAGTAVRAAMASTVAGAKLRALEELERAGSADPSVAPAIERERAVLAEVRADQQDISARDTDRNLLERGAKTAAVSLATTLPALAVGIGTRNPALAAASMFPTTEAQKYGELRDQGTAPREAEQHAAFQGAVESGTELLPFGALLKNAPIASRLMRFLASELPGESLATLLQGASDHVAETRRTTSRVDADGNPQPPPVDERMVMDGLREAARQLPETWVATVLAGGAQTAVAQLASPRQPSGGQPQPSPLPSFNRIRQAYPEPQADEQPRQLPAPPDFTVDSDGGAGRPGEPRPAQPRLEGPRPSSVMGVDREGRAAPLTETELDQAQRDAQAQREARQTLGEQQLGRKAPPEPARLLPAPGPSGTFVTTPDGQTRELTQDEAEWLERASSARRDYERTTGLDKVRSTRRSDAVTVDAAGNPAAIDGPALPAGNRQTEGPEIAGPATEHLAAPGRRGARADFDARKSLSARLAEPSILDDLASMARGDQVQDWWADMPRDAADRPLVPLEVIPKLIAKVRRGERIGKNQTAAVEAMIDWLDRQDAEYQRVRPPDDQLAGVDLEPTEEVRYDAAAATRAAELDPDAFERAAIQSADDDAGFATAIRPIVSNARAEDRAGGTADPGEAAGGAVGEQRAEYRGAGGAGRVSGGAEPARSDVPATGRGGVAEQWNPAAQRDVGSAGDVQRGQPDPRTRPGTNADQLALRERAIADLERRLGGARRGVRVAGAALAEDFRIRGSISLAGRPVRSIAELAAVAQVYRDPRFETLRWIAVKNGVVTHDVAMSARLPGAVMFDAQASKAAAAFYADLQTNQSDGWFLLHNHPSGDPSPSDADLNFTRFLAAQVPNFRGHVIVNHDSYGMIDAQFSDKVVQRPGLSAGSYSGPDLVPHALLGAKVTTPDSLAAVGKQAGGPGTEAVTVVCVNNRGLVRALVTIPTAQVRGARGLAMMSRLMRQTGSGRLHLVVQSDPAPIRHLIDTGIVTDAFVIDTGATLSTNQTDTAFEPAAAQQRDERRQNLGRKKAPSSRVMEKDEGYSTVNANPFGAAYRWYQQQAQRSVDWFVDRWGYRWDVLGKLPDAKGYKIWRYEALGEIDDSQRIVRELYDALRPASAVDAQAVYDYLTTAGATPDDIADGGVREAAERAKRLIDQQGRRLVSKGLLTQAAYAAHKDAYLPRVYLRYLLGDDNYRSMGSGKRLSDLGNLKQRKDLPEAYRRIILGEITDPAFLASFSLSRTMRDLALLDFLERVASRKQWVPSGATVSWAGRQVTPFWLASEAKRLRQQADLYADQERDGQAARRLADEMDTLANRAIAALPGSIEEHKQFPDSPRYGALRGLWVRKEIYNDLVGSRSFMEPDPALFERVMGPGGMAERFTSLWKLSKVALNPPSQVRNFVSNAMLLHLSGVPLRRVASGELFVRAIHELRTQGRYYQAARKYGLFSATFANNELFRIEREWLDLQRRIAGEGGLQALKYYAGVVGEKASDVYQLTEALGKLAYLIDAVDRRGMEMSDAMIEAHDALFDYSMVPRSVARARVAPLGIPFLTFYYKVLPRLAKVAITDPLRFAPYVGVAWALQEMIQGAYDVDDDDLRKLREALPRWVRERGHALLLPWKDQHGRWQVIDLGYMVPWGMFADVATQVGEGEYRRALATVGILSGPIPDLIAALQSGIDTFTGKEIADPGAPAAKQLEQMLVYLWNLAVPPILAVDDPVTGQAKGPTGALIDAVSGRVNPRTREPGLTVAQAAGRMFGLSIYPVNPEVSRMQNIRAMHAELREMQATMKDRLRDPNLTKEDRQEVRRVWIELIRRQQRMIRQYSEDSRVPERLLRTPAEGADAA